MLRSCAILLLLVSVSTALTCYKCAVFNMTVMTEEQAGQMTGALVLLGAPKCTIIEEDVTQQCEANQDQCQKISVSSKLGGDEAHDGYLLQCGQSSSIESLCPTYTGMAKLAGFIIDGCSSEGCDSSKCYDPTSGATFSNHNLYILIASLATFILASL
ncbi:uncharacterized protein LOC134813935 [Bolinopsis microptera]|uniref:uncharacterized protein LOC134813935 n=1 Tax=Bolinopsis microptera TaxID=2820187 RepID=UPI003079C3B1